ncbi:MAG: hypothetical protein L0220_32840 [Acidobacteria bacterium]|nr:hypothetical protein [Acidobacteriota bacterium]
MSVDINEITEQQATTSAGVFQKTGPSFAERVRQAKTAFLSCPQRLQSQEIVNAVRRKFSSVQVSTFEKFKNQPDCRQLISDCIAESDLLIIATDEGRLLVRGVFAELSVARTHKKLIIIFDITTERWQDISVTTWSRKKGGECEL